MSAEDFIRKKHELEDALKLFYSQLDEFQAIARLLSNRELEICLARAIDRAAEEPYPHARLLAKLKAFLLDAALAGRPAGFRPSSFQRFVRSVQPDRIINQLIHWSFTLPIVIDEGKFPDVEARTLTLPEVKRPSS